MYWVKIEKRNVNWIRKIKVVVQLLDVAMLNTYITHHYVSIISSDFGVKL